LLETHDYAAFNGGKNALSESNQQRFIDVPADCFRARFCTAAGGAAIGQRLKWSV
jgi:hypothetical protein